MFVCARAILLACEAPTYSHQHTYLIQVGDVLVPRSDDDARCSADATPGRRSDVVRGAWCVVRGGGDTTTYPGSTIHRLRGRGYISGNGHLRLQQNTRPPAI